MGFDRTPVDHSVTTSPPYDGFAHGWTAHGWTDHGWVDHGWVDAARTPGSHCGSRTPAAGLPSPGVRRRESLMRRGSVVAVLLGAFVLTWGVALPRYAYPRLAMAPLDPETVSVSEGTASTLFDRANLVQLRNVDLTATVKVRGDLGAPEAVVGGDEAVWMAGTVMKDSSGVVRGTTEQRVCLDRHTGAARPACTGQFVSHDGRVDDQVRPSGQVLRFPFGTQQRDYPFFDPGTRTVAPMVFVDVDIVDDLPVYRFVQSIPQTPVGDVTVPGELVNRPDAGSVEAELARAVNRAVWVEPTSGLIVRDQEAIRQVIREPGGADGTVELEVILTSTPDTVRRSVARASQARDRLRLISGTVPVALANAGLLLIAAGILMTALRRRTVGRVDRPGRDRR